MANRRMFSKSVTNSSAFLMMPLSSQALYMHLGMNADDDGYAEFFGIQRMCGANTDDLKLLHAKGFVRLFDDKVLVIRDWKENNYIQADRYQRSKYLDVYGVDTECIQDVSTLDTQVRLGKDSIGKDKKATAFGSLSSLTVEVCAEIAQSYKVSPKAVEKVREDLDLYCKSRGKQYKDYRATLMGWVRRKVDEGKISHVDFRPPAVHEEPPSIDEARRAAHAEGLRKTLLEKTGMGTTRAQRGDNSPARGSE